MGLAVGGMPLVQALERALSILEAFSPPCEELGIAELSERVRLPRPTVSRLVSTLVARGYLRRNPESRKYRLGFKVLSLTAALQAGLRLPEVAAPVLKRLRDELKETVYIDVVDGDERVCVMSFEGLQTVRTFVPVGQRSPLYAGADSRMLLACLSDEEIDAYLARAELKPYTEYTITDKNRLKEEVARSREAGFTFSVAEFNPGSACVSVPLKDFTGESVAALSVSFPVSRANPQTISYYARRLFQGADEISAHLGYAGPPLKPEADIVLL